MRRYPLALVVVVVATLASVCGGSRERQYYTPPTRDHADLPAGTAGPVTFNATPTRTPRPLGSVGTPYPTPATAEQQRSRARALSYCPKANLDWCVGSFVIIDAAPSFGALCVAPNGDFWYEMDISYSPAPHPGAPTMSGARPDQGLGAPCYRDRGATTITFVGRGAPP